MSLELHCRPSLTPGMRAALQWTRPGQLGKAVGTQQRGRVQSAVSATLTAWWEREVSSQGLPGLVPEGQWAAQRKRRSGCGQGKRCFSGTV